MWDHITQVFTTGTTNNKNPRTPTRDVGRYAAPRHPPLFDSRAVSASAQRQAAYRPDAASQCPQARDYTSLHLDSSTSCRLDSTHTSGLSHTPPQYCYPRRHTRPLRSLDRLQGALKLQLSLGVALRGALPVPRKPHDPNQRQPLLAAGLTNQCRPPGAPHLSAAPLCSPRAPYKPSLAPGSCRALPAPESLACGLVGRSSTSR